MTYTPVSRRVSTVNSSTTLLNAAATFTGTFEDVAHYDSMVVAVATDQDGTFTIQFSPDGTNVDSTLTRYYRTDLIEAPHRFTITRRYCRVTFTNTSASNQTYLRLQTIYGDKTELNIPLDATIASDFDSISVRPTKFEYEAALGLRQGRVVWNKWGYNDAIVGTGTPEVVASWGGTFTRLSAAQTLSVVSLSTDDDDGGTGANSVLLYGVDENWVAQTEEVTMDGTTPVTTSNQWIGLNRVEVLLAGDDEVNADAITITGSTDTGTIVGQIPAGAGSSQQCIFYTQANYTTLITRLFINVVKLAGGGLPETTTTLWVYNSNTNSRYDKGRFYMDADKQVTLDKDWDNEPLTIPEQSVIWIETSSDTADTEASVRFGLLEVRNVNA